MGRNQLIAPLTFELHRNLTDVDTRAKVGFEVEAVVALLSRPPKEQERPGKTNFKCCCIVERSIETGEDGCFSRRYNHCVRYFSQLVSLFMLNIYIYISVMGPTGSGQSSVRASRISMVYSPSAQCKQLEFLEIIFRISCASSSHGVSYHILMFCPSTVSTFWRTFWKRDFVLSPWMENGTVVEFLARRILTMITDATNWVCLVRNFLKSGAAFVIIINLSRRSILHLAFNILMPQKSSTGISKECVDITFNIA